MIIYKPVLSSDMEAEIEENMWHSQFSQKENFLQMFYPHSLLSFPSPVPFMISNPERIKCYFSMW